MKQNIAMGLTLTLALSLLAGCGGTASTDGETVALTGKVSTNGSTSMEMVMGALIESFAQEEGDVTVTYDPTGSGSGVEAAATGAADIGLTSRALKEEELERGLRETVVAKDGIALVVNGSNTVEDLTVEQIAAIARGEITNWSELGGQDVDVAFVGREAGSGTRDAFEELTGTADQCVYLQELTSTGAVKTAVETTPGGIGYISLSSVDEGVRALKVNGVAPTEETVLDGSYPIQRPFVFATLADQPLSQAAQAFFDYATSAASAPMYEAAGVVPVFR